MRDDNDYVILNKSNAYDWKNLYQYSNDTNNTVQYIGIAMRYLMYNSY